MSVSPLLFAVCSIDLWLAPDRPPANPSAGRWPAGGRSSRATPASSPLGNARAISSTPSLQFSGVASFPRRKRRGYRVRLQPTVQRSRRLWRVQDDRSVGLDSTELARITRGREGRWTQRGRRRHADVGHPSTCFPGARSEMTPRVAPLWGYYPSRRHSYDWTVADSINTGCRRVPSAVPSATPTEAISLTMSRPSVTLPQIV